MNKAHKRSDRSTNWSKMRTDHLTSILDDPYTRGNDGQDYAPYKEELEAELWRRVSDHAEKSIEQHNKEQKRHQKYLATLTKLETL